MSALPNRLIHSITMALLAGHWSLDVRAECLEARTIDPADFVAGVDNPFMPLEPGTTFVYAAETEDEFIWNEVTVTHDTKEVFGVTCTVVYDVEWVFDPAGGPGIPIEETFDWYAQDSSGNVWYFGEDTKEYLYDDAGNFIGFSTEGSWEAGVDGALPGIVMLGSPAPGVCYSQEFLEDVAEDMGKVLNLDVTVSLAEFGDLEGCLKTKEWTKLEPGSVEHKYYFPGVGLVFIEELQGKTVEVELVDVLVE